MSRFEQYLAAIASANNLGVAVEWLFYPGMLPESRQKWWGDFGCRPSVHEGIDICFFRRPAGSIRHLAAGTRVPAWSEGTVINICNDFLGHTLVVEPEGGKKGFTRILEVFSHLVPCSGMAPGTRVEAGRIIACTSDTRARGSVLLSHLHLSCIKVPAHIPAYSLDWSLFPFREKVNIFNPVFM